MNYPEMCYANDIYKNCIILKWGEAGYYPTDYPKGGYTDEVIDELNQRAGITHAEWKAMQICSMANPADWKAHYEMCVERYRKVEK